MQPGKWVCPDEEGLIVLSSNLVEDRPQFLRLSKRSVPYADAELASSLVDGPINRDGPCRFLRYCRQTRTWNNDDLDFESDQLSGQRLQFGRRVRAAALDNQILPLDPAQTLQLLIEWGLSEFRWGRKGPRVEATYPTYLFCVLRV